MQKAVRWPCGAYGMACSVYGRGVGNKSIQCTSCQKWVHRKYSGIKGSMYSRDRPKLINSSETKAGPKFSNVVSAKKETEAEFYILFSADTETETENQ